MLPWRAAHPRSAGRRATAWSPSVDFVPWEKPDASLSVSQAAAEAAVVVRAVMKLVLEVIVVIGGVAHYNTDGGSCNIVYNGFTSPTGVSLSPSRRLKSSAYHEEPVWAFVSPFPSLLAIRLPPAHLAAPGSPLSPIRRSYLAVPCRSAPGERLSHGFQSW